jgi:hypothetical protein
MIVINTRAFLLQVAFLIPNSETCRHCLTGNACASVASHEFHILLQKQIKWRDANSSWRREKTMWTRLGQRGAAATEAPCLYSIDIDNTQHTALRQQDPLTIYSIDIDNTQHTALRQQDPLTIIRMGIEWATIY